MFNNRISNKLDLANTLISQCSLRAIIKDLQERFSSCIELNTQDSLDFAIRQYQSHREIITARSSECLNERLKMISDLSTFFLDNDKNHQAIDIALMGLELIKAHELDKTEEKAFLLSTCGIASLEENSNLQADEYFEAAFKVVRNSPKIFDSFAFIVSYNLNLAVTRSQFAELPELIKEALRIAPESKTSRALLLGDSCARALWACCHEGTTAISKRSASEILGCKTLNKAMNQFHQPLLPILGIISLFDLNVRLSHHLLSEATKSPYFSKPNSDSMIMIHAGMAFFDAFNNDLRSAKRSISYLNTVVKCFKEDCLPPSCVLEVIEKNTLYENRDKTRAIIRYIDKLLTPSKSHPHSLS